MPGPVSCSYPGPGDDPHDELWDAIDAVRERLSLILQSLPRNILEVVRGEGGERFQLQMPERTLRILRFACSVALGEEKML